MSAPEPNAERATPGRFCTTLSVSPCVPGTRRASSVRMTVCTDSFLMRAARTTVSSSMPSCRCSTKYFTVFFWSFSSVSSVATVTSVRRRQLHLVRAERHVDELEVAVVVGARVDAAIVERDGDAGHRLLGEALEHAPFEVHLRPELHHLRLDGEVVAIVDLHRRRLAVDLGRLEHELLRGGDGGGVEVGRRPICTTPTLPDLAVGADLDRQQHRRGHARGLLVGADTPPRRSARAWAPWSRCGTCCSPSSPAPRRAPARPAQSGSGEQHHERERRSERGAASVSELEAARQREDAAGHRLAAAHRRLEASTS